MASNQYFSIGKLIEENEEVRKELDVIIDYLRKMGKLESEEQLILLLKNILIIFAANIKDFPTFEMLNEEQQQLIKDELKKILHSLGYNKNQILGHDLINTIANQLFVAMHKTLMAREEELDEVSNLTAKDRERVKEDLRKAAIYELYKMTNPRRLAGETKIENFINNVVLRGLKTALKYEGGSSKDLKNYKEEFLKDLRDKHQEYIKNSKNNDKNGFTR